jgi:acyl-CoA thioester hydrolase
MTGSFRAVAHPWLCDVMGHLTTRHYVAMFDDASYHFLFEVFAWSGTDAANGVGFADVRHELDYAAEVGSGDLLEITGRLEKLGTKSVTIVYEMTNLSHGELAATLRSVAVCFDTKARKAVAFPDAWRRKAEGVLAQGVVRGSSA